MMTEGWSNRGPGGKPKQEEFEEVRRPWSELLFTNSLKRTRCDLPRIKWYFILAITTILLLKALVKYGAEQDDQFILRCEYCF